MFEYSICYENENNTLLPTEKLIIDKINNNIENNFSYTSPRENCLNFAPNRMINGIRIASRSKYYCTAKIKENGKQVYLNLKEDLDKIKEFAKYIIDEISNGAYRDIILKRNTEMRSTITESNDKPVVKDYDRQSIIEASRIANEIIDMLKMFEVIKTKPEVMNKLQYGTDYIYHIKSHPTKKFVTDFMPEFRDCIETVYIPKIKNEKSKKIIYNMFDKINDLLK